MRAEHARSPPTGPRGDMGVHPSKSPGSSPTESCRRADRAEAEPWYVSLCYALLDVFFSLYARSWPLTLSCYVFFAVPLELAFWLHTRRFRHVRSLAPNCMFTGWKDSREARRCWERVLKEDSAEAIERGLRSWFAGEGEMGADDVASVLSLLIYNSHLADLGEAKCAVIESMVQMVEAVRSLHADCLPHCMLIASLIDRVDGPDDRGGALMASDSH